MSCVAVLATIVFTFVFASIHAESVHAIERLVWRS
jgi:hypothetical protein